MVRNVALTTAQEQIKDEVLSAIPAPCCANNSAATCCCPCNMAKSIWGLSNHLLAERSYDATQLRDAVLDWVAFINPSGYTGDACYTGGCGRSFEHNGCGGMNEEEIIL